MSEIKMLKCDLCGKECADYEATIGAVRFYINPLHYTFVMCPECDDDHYMWVLNRMKKNGLVVEE